MRQRNFHIHICIHTPGGGKGDPSRLLFLVLVLVTTSTDTRRCVRSVSDWSYSDTPTGQFPGPSPSLPLCEMYPWTESTYNYSRGHRFRPPQLFSHRRTPRPSSCSLCGGSRSWSPGTGQWGGCRRTDWACQGPRGNHPRSPGVWDRTQTNSLNELGRLQCKNQTLGVIVIFVEEKRENILQN